MADLEPGVVLSPSTLAAMERLSVTVQGRDWPATLGDFTLVGPVNNQSPWRWYERHHDGSIERIKVDHQLQPIKPMSTDFSITPPLELLREWCRSSREHEDLEQFWRYIAIQAAQWGADQEMEAIIHWLITGPYAFLVLGRSHDNLVHDLRAARRPKPPSLKEEALALLDQHEEGWRPSPKDWDTIRRAIEALPND
jgi:hypothetical protein